MSNNLVAEIRELQARIENESNKAFSYLLTSLFESEKEKEDTSKFETEKPNSDLAILVWLCLKIELECQAVHNGILELEDSLRTDIDEVFNYVQKCEYEYKLNRNVVADAIDLMLSIGTIREKDLQIYSSKYIAKFMRNKKEISNGMYFLFTSVTKQLFSVGKREKAYHIVEQLFALSRTRNSKTLHKQLVVNVINIISAEDLSAVCRFADIEKENFVEDGSEYAGDFYWFYAYGLQEEGNTKAASAYFGSCYIIRKNLYGETHWLTALTKRNKAAIEYKTEKCVSARNDLINFVQCVENGKLIGVDQRGSEENVKAAEAEAIWLLLKGHADTISALPEYKNLIDIYENICEEFSDTGNTLISMRFVWNFRGNYYLQCGEYILAEDAFQHALMEKDNEEAKKILSDDQIRTNLLIIANMQNDGSSTASILAKFSDGETDLNETDSLRVYITIIGDYIQSGIRMEEDEIHDIRELVQEICRAVLEEDALIESYGTTAMFIYAVAMYFIQYEIAGFDEQKMYLETLKCITKDAIIDRLSIVQKYMIVQAEAILAWNLGLAEVEKYINKLLCGTEEKEIPLITKANMCQTAAVFFGKNGRCEMAVYCAEKSLDYLTKLWHKYVEYANDTRLVNILSPLQTGFSNCYTIIRKYTDIENAYEKVLQFKMLASLAGRERNRILHSIAVDSGLVKKINDLQNKLAELATEEIFQDCVVEYEEIESKLRKYESEFARKFPKNINFEEISWKFVADAVPDDSVVLEYFYTIDDFGKNQFEVSPGEDALTVLDLYCVKKQSGKISLKRYTIKNAETVIETAMRFIEIYQEKSANGGVSKNDNCLEDLRYDLYEALLKPVMKDIGQNTTIYFAPDSALVNLPFELLYENKSLEESHQIVKIECARDFLFVSSEETFIKRSLVIGNPEYSIKENEITMDTETEIDQTRAIDLNLLEIPQLPFAEIEAHRVAEYFATFPWTGKEATKEKVFLADGCENLHIATHGFFDLSGETDAIYSSCLMFAGVKNWMMNLPNSKEYGNGVVTADEISRLNLRSTKLVVLSSCLNGRSDMIISKGFQGMVGAFAAAGVKFVIAHLWNAPESIGTVILMDTFYYCYVNLKMDPPLALAKAKKYLKTLTIDEMREQGWFDYIRNCDLDRASKQRELLLEKFDGRFRPYKDEIFWGGFSCYRCN